MTLDPPGAPPADLVVRRLRTDDLPRVLEIENASFTMPWRRATFEGMLRRADTDLLAAEWAGRLVGYAVCWTVVDQAELGNVAVAAEARGRGIGGVLVDQAAACVRARGGRECYLEVRESNTGAQSLYRGRGFVLVGRRRRYYTHPTEDALVMRRTLDARA